MRTYFKLNTNESGVLISKILKLSCSYNHLQRGDVLMSLNGIKVADDGTVIISYCQLALLVVRF